MKNIVQNELKYINDNFEFTLGCPPDLHELILEKGYVDIVEGAVILTVLGETELGINFRDTDDENVINDIEEEAREWATIEDIEEGL